MLNDKLSPREALFVAKLFECNFNGTLAAVEAGYSARSARTQASRMLKKDNIRAAIDRHMAELIMPPNEVLMRLANHARGDMRDFIGKQPEDLANHPGGNLIKKVKYGVTFPPKRKPTSIADAKDRVKAGLYESEEEKPVVFIESIELYDAQAALVQLGRHHGLFQDKTDVTSNGETLRAATVYLPEVVDEDDA